MAKFSSSYRFLLSLLLLSQICFLCAWCGSIVKSLPGFEGPLPFVLETGYVGVGEGEDVQVFYYFIESERNPKEDPLLLWLTGGPGCSGFSGLVLEIGPLAFKKEEYNGSLPSLILRPHSWTQVSSIIFVDLPVRTGFTYTRTEFATQTSDSLFVHHAHEFLRKWLILHPSFLLNEVYIAGDSYSGIPIPPIVQEIFQGNEKGVQPWINLQGYVLGNPITTGTEDNYKIPFAHGMALISHELYESLQKNCKGEYINVDPKNELCSRDLESFNEAKLDLNNAQILEPNCEDTDKRLFNAHRKLPPLECRTYEHFLCNFWANDENVRRALHIHKGSIREWERCDFNVLTKYDIPSSYEYHVNLSRKGFRSLIYSGDHDFDVSFLATEAWIRSLNYSIVDDWRQWRVNGQVAGYTRTYSNQMTYATVKGGGHTAPEYKPEECLAMFSRWISKRPLHECQRSSNANLAET